MFDAIRTKNNKLKRFIIGTISFSTVMFIFQACYGTPKDFGIDTEISGKVNSNEDNSPIEGIKVSFDNIPQYTYTDKNGEFTIFVSSQKTHKLNFEDNSSLNKKFINKDTLVKTKKGRLFLEIKMQKTN